MNAKSKLDRIAGALKGRGEPGTASQIARLLNVSPSTVTRWWAGKVEPRGRQGEALDVLHRTVVNAEQGNDDAKKILGMVLGAAGAGLLGLGLGGVLIAAGLGWVIGETVENGGDPKVKGEPK